jgi:hypothetical protein
LPRREHAGWNWHLDARVLSCSAARTRSTHQRLVARSLSQTFHDALGSRALVALRTAALRRATLSGSREYSDRVGPLMPEQPAPLHDLDHNLPVVVTDAWRASFPEAHIGLLRVDNVVNQPAPALLQQQTQRFEAELR